MQYVHTTCMYMYKVHVHVYIGTLVLVQRTHNLAFSCTLYTVYLVYVNMYRFPEQGVIESHVTLKEVPRTEDFITFLCLRGTVIMYKNVKYMYMSTVHAVLHG